MDVGDYFMMALMTLNAGAMVAYSLAGNWTKGLYWLCALGLNFCVLRLK